jgi:hypothetical protein
MTEREKNELREYSAYLLKRYGFNIPYTDPVMPALFTIHKELSDTKDSNTRLAKTIDQALERMNPTVYNFNAPGEAWKFQIGNSLKWFFVCLTIVLTLFIGFSWMKVKSTVEEAENIIQLASPIEKSLLNRVEKDSDGFYYIEFKESLGSSVMNFIEYDERGDGRVRVYLGKEW